MATFDGGARSIMLLLSLISLHWDDASPSRRASVTSTSRCIPPNSTCLHDRRLEWMEQSLLAAPPPSYSLETAVDRGEKTAREVAKAQIRYEQHATVKRNRTHQAPLFALFQPQLLNRIENILFGRGASPATTMPTTPATLRASASTTPTASVPLATTTNVSYVYPEVNEIDFAMGVIGGEMGAPLRLPQASGPQQAPQMPMQRQSSQLPGQASQPPQTPGQQPLSAPQVPSDVPPAIIDPTQQLPPQAPPQLQMTGQQLLPPPQMPPPLIEPLPQPPEIEQPPPLVIPPQSYSVVACFSGDSHVRLADGSSGFKRMDELEVGDWIWGLRHRDDRDENGEDGDQNSFSDGEVVPIRVSGWLHREPGSITNFHRLQLESGRLLEATAKHLIYTAECHSNSVNPLRLATVDSLRPGHCLYTTFNNGDNSLVLERIVSVQRSVVKRGIFAPLTATGTLFVDGVLVSCYTQLPGSGTTAVLQRTLFDNAEWWSWLWDNETGEIKPPGGTILSSLIIYVSEFVLT